MGNYHDLVRTDVFPVLPATVGRVLDVGGGVGATSVALKRAGHAGRVVVVDRVADDAVDGVDEVFTGDLDDEAFLAGVLEKAGPFDTILALDVLEHLHDPWSAVAVLHRGLAPDGCVVASIPNVNYYELVLPLVLRGRFDLTDAGILDRTHLRWFARHGAIELMTSSGLRIEAIRPNLTRRKHVLLDTLSFGALTRFLAMHYVIRARRVD